MSKQNITTDYLESTHDKHTDIALTPGELRALYMLRENDVQEMVEVTVMLDDGQRRLALRMLKAMVEHRRAMLS
ncbi:MAG: hypothetical protein ACXIVD_02150 [Salinarimonas sp.]